MKLALNGAVTIGTMDGANIEILEEVGWDNFFAFGLTSEAIHAMRTEKSYQPQHYYESDPRIRRVVDAFSSSLFCPNEPDLFAWVSQTVLDPNDAHVHLADLPQYIEAHEKASETFCDSDKWGRMSILNVARIGRFSSDRTILEYGREIWNITPKSLPQAD
jgi:starch phosphorylase